MDEWRLSHLGGGGEGVAEEPTYAYLKPGAGSLRRFSLQNLSTKQRLQLRQLKQGSEVAGELLTALLNTPQIPTGIPLRNHPSWPPGGWVSTYSRGDLLRPADTAVLQRVKLVRRTKLEVVVTEGGRVFTGDLRLPNEAEARLVKRLLKAAAGSLTLEEAGDLELRE